MGDWLQLAHDTARKQNNPLFQKIYLENKLDSAMLEFHDQQVILKTKLTSFRYDQNIHQLRVRGKDNSWSIVVSAEEGVTPTGKKSKSGFIFKFIFQNGKPKTFASISALMQEVVKEVAKILVVPDDGD